MDSDRRSAQVEWLEVVETGRRRRWSEDEKLKIVLESLQAPRQVAATARRYGVSRSLLLRWRRSFRPEPKEAADQTGFVPAMVVAAAMIPIPSGVRVWIATGHTDMRRGMNSLAVLVQEAFRRDPHGGDLYVFRGKSGKLIKILWHDGLGMSLYAKRLERGRFIWPSAADGAVVITSAQLGYMLEGIDWRNPLHTWRPSAAG